MGNSLERQGTIGIIFLTVWSIIFLNAVLAYICPLKHVDDHKQKYAEITEDCLLNEITDKCLQFLQTKHLQCAVKYRLE